MPIVISPEQVVLLFQSITAISAFKHESACNDFYIVRDVLMMVGAFQPGQVQLAIKKYEAVLK